MPLPLVLYKSIGVLLTSEGVVKSPMTAGEDELRGVLGRNAAELVPAASPEVAFALAADIVLGRSSSVGQVRARRVCSSTTQVAPRPSLDHWFWYAS